MKVYGMVIVEKMLRAKVRCGFFRYIYVLIFGEEIEEVGATVEVTRVSTSQCAKTVENRSR